MKELKIERWNDEECRGTLRSIHSFRVPVRVCPFSEAPGLQDVARSFFLWVVFRWPLPRGRPVGRAARRPSYSRIGLRTRQLRWETFWSLLQRKPLVVVDWRSSTVSPRRKTGPCRKLFDPADGCPENNWLAKKGKPGFCVFTHPRQTGSPSGRGAARRLRPRGRRRTPCRRRPGTPRRARGPARSASPRCRSTCRCWDRGTWRGP